MHRLITQKIAAFSISLILGHLVFLMPMNVIADQQHSAPCGPECTCGCVQGGPCTCHKKDPNAPHQEMHSHDAEQNVPANGN